MKVRAVTLGLDLPCPEVVAAPFEHAAGFLSATKDAFGARGVEVQTTRIAGPDLGATLGKVGAAGLAGWATEIEGAARTAGIDYLSFGRIPAQGHSPLPPRTRSRPS